MIDVTGRTLLKGYRIEELIGLSMRTITLLVSLSLVVGCCPLEKTQTATPGADQSRQPADATTFPTPKPTETEKLPMAGSITLFKNVVAGDYRLLHLSDSGSMEVIQWNRLNQIIAYQQGEIPAERTSELFAGVQQLDSSVTESVYDVYPLPEDSTLIYEDIYYLLHVQASGIDRTIIAHEAAMPEVFSEFVADLFSLSAETPSQEVTGQYLLAGDHDLIGFKRYVRKKNQMSLETLTAYPTLADVLKKPYSLHAAPDFWQTELGKHFDEDLTSLVVVLPERSWDVLLLSSME